MKALETCSLCPEFTCVEWMRGRSIVSNAWDYSEFDTMPICDCPIRRAVLMEDLENGDKTGLMPTVLLGC